MEVGDFYGGGVVYYILQSGDAGYIDGETHGLICAVRDYVSLVTWGCQGTLITGADGSGIGSGAQNTIDIVAGCTDYETAAEICASLTLNGYDDWFLPSKDELNLIYQNRTTINSAAQVNSGLALTTGTYWSSTEYSSDVAWGQSFFDGGQDFCNKGSQHCVRAVRAF